MMTVRCIEAHDGFTVGKEYKVYHIENGDFGLISDDKEQEYYPKEWFEVTEAEKYVYHGPSDPLAFIDGHEYIKLGEAHDGMWSITDESGDDYLYHPGKHFTKVEKRESRITGK